MRRCLTNRPTGPATVCALLDQIASTQLNPHCADHPYMSTKYAIMKILIAIREIKLTKGIITSSSMIIGICAAFIYDIITTIFNNWIIYGLFDCGSYLNKHPIICGLTIPTEWEIWFYSKNPWRFDFPISIFFGFFIGLVFYLFLLILKQHQEK